MPIRLSHLKANLRTINVRYFDDSIVVTYRPDELVPHKQSEVQERIDEEGGETVLAEELCRVMVQWDVVDDNDEMIPLTPKAFAEHAISGPLMLAISDAIGEDSRPKPKSARGSFAR